MLFDEQNVLAYFSLSRMESKAQAPRFIVNNLNQVKAFPPMLNYIATRGKNKGSITMRLLGLNDNYKANAPSLHLECKGENFSGFKQVFADHKSVFFGYPDTKGSNVKFANYCDVGYLFFCSYNNIADEAPSNIEILVLRGAKTMLETYARAHIIKGIFNPILERFRDSVKNEK